MISYPCKYGVILRYYLLVGLMFSQVAHKLGGYMLYTYSAKTKREFKFSKMLDGLKNGISFRGVLITVKETERHQFTVDHITLPSCTTVSDRLGIQTYLIIFRDENHLNLIDVCLGLYTSKLNMHGRYVTKYNNMNTKCNKQNNFEK